MLYLEDYLEMIEHLPQELRDRFTVMREMDLQVQNATESLEKRVKAFFSNVDEMKPAEQEAEAAEIKRLYGKALEDADEKVQLSNNMYDLVAMYVRRLDTECHKFKMELEADHAGITEILEKRSEEMDVTTNGSQKENRYSAVASRPSSSGQEKKRDMSMADYKRLLAVEKLLPDIRPMANCQPSVSAAMAPNVNYGLGGTAIAAAATQAIAATQQMQQGRRTASLKASYEAISSVVGNMGVELANKDLAGAAQAAVAAAQDTTKKHKKRSGAVQSRAASAEVADPDLPSSSEVNYDPNEPRYCICNEVAYGGMVACDNKSCVHEWFHYPCVGITDAPKGTWYCPQCSEQKRQQRSRKKKGHSGYDDRNIDVTLRHAN